jgi:hypothetical protein
MSEPRRAAPRAEPQSMAAGLLVSERDLLRRAWTKAERRVVLNGLFGRMLIAVEPMLCFVVFGALTAGLIFFPLPASSKLSQHDSALVLAPVFGLAALAFLAYAIVVMVPPVRAFRHTFLPIYIVDGYIRYRKPDRDTEADSNGYIAVLNEERRTIAEWPSLGSSRITEVVKPALIEFSFYGGIHRIDGHSTGAVPESIPAVGVGNNVPRF